MGDGSTDDRLPEESNSQRIGQEAVQAFNANHPLNWRPIPKDGDSDFGLDQQVQVVDADKKVSGGIFHVQIKGSEKPEFSGDGDAISVNLSIKTLNYYARIADPVMLVAVDLSSGEYPKDCRVHWVWISETIRTALNGKSDFRDWDQQSITFKVPTANILKPDFDVLPQLRDLRRRKQAMEGFLHAVGANKNVARSTLDTVQGITAKIETSGESLVTSLTDSFDSPWVDPPKDSIQGQLHTAHTLLSTNKDSDAQAIIEELNGEIDSSLDHEFAEYHYLSGRILALNSDDAGALKEYEAAYKGFSKSEKYAAAYFETRFRLAFPDDDGSGEIQNIIRDFPESASDRLLALKARLLAANGDYQAAAKTLETVDAKEAAVTKALAAYLQKNWSSTVSICEEELARGLVPLRTRTTLTTILARAYFYDSMAACAIPSDDVIPPFGLPGTNIEKYEKAWNTALEALALLREQNWPANSEYIVDILGSIGPALNKHRDILPDLRALSKKRPNLAAAHEHLARLAALAKEYQIEWEALDALDAIEGTTDTVHLRIHSLYSQRRYRDALLLAEEKLIDANSEHILHASCLGIAALCAQECVDPDKAKPFLDQLKSEKKWADSLAVHEFVSTANSSPLQREKARDELIAAYNRIPDSQSIQDNLFDVLDAENDEQAELCLELAQRINRRRLLAYSELLHLSQAYVTLSDWKGLVNLADHAIQQYGHIPRTAAIKAVALDGLGDASGALQILEQLVTEHPDEDVAISSYVNICIRTGFHEKAAQQIELLFQKATDNESQLTYLRQLFSLKYSVNKDDTNLAEVAWRFGEIANQQKEKEEGLFLLLFVAATHSAQAKVSDDRVKEFQERADTFFERWPESNVIRRFDLPGSASPEELTKAIERVIGVTEKEKAWYKKLENQLVAGELVVPYCWRPRRLLMNIANVPHLWHVTQNSNKDARQYHFTMVADPAEQRDLARGLSLPPLVDLTTLLVLYDLDILKHVFSIFSRIAVSAETALEIQQLAHPFIGGFRIVVGIRDFLKANVDRIVQPSGHGWEGAHEKDPLNVPLEEIKYLVTTGSYSLYLDDIATRVYAQAENDAIQVVTTLDVLDELERREILTPSEVAQKLSLLMRWNIGVVLKERYFLSAIPAAVDTVSGLDELIEVLMLDSTFKDLVDGVWDIRMDYKATLVHVAAILADVAKSKKVRAELVAAIWAVWQIKIELRGLDVDAEHHQGTVFVRTAVAAKGDSAAIKKLWDAYIWLVQRRFGTRMDEEKEKQSRQLVGSIAAEVVHQSDSETLGDELLEILLSPYESGVIERDWVNQAYVDKRQSLENVPGGPE